MSKLLVAEQFLNNTSYMISMFFGKIRITCFLNHDSFFISIIRGVTCFLLGIHWTYVQAFHTYNTCQCQTRRMTSPCSLQLWWLLLLVLMQKCWSTDGLVVGQSLWDSTELRRQLFALQLVLNTWKVELYFVVSRLYGLVVVFINRERVMKDRALLDGIF